VFKPSVYTTPQGKEENESVFLNIYIGNKEERLKYKQDEDEKGNDAINITPLGMEMKQWKSYQPIDNIAFIFLKEYDLCHKR